MDREVLVAESGRNPVDTGHLSVVDYELTAATYVSDPPLEFGPSKVFLGDLAPADRELLDFEPANIPEVPDIFTFVANERFSDDTGGFHNFMFYFGREGTVASLFKQNSIFKQRLRAVNPELVARLDAVIANPYQEVEDLPASFSDLNNETLEDLFTAYNTMVHLVSIEEAREITAEGNVRTNPEILTV